MSNLLGRIRSEARQTLAFGMEKPRIVLSVATQKLVIGRALRKFSQPGISAFFEAGSQFYTDVEALTKSLSDFDNAMSFETLKNEYEELKDELAERYTSRSKSSLAYPLNWAIESQTALFLYAITRLVRPNHMVETGVANGHSSFFVIQAMRANGTGTLTSIDIRANVGGLLSDDERAYWDLRLLSRPRQRKEFRSILEELAPLDIFVHDSEHLYTWQSEEYSTATHYLRPSGLLMSDDIEFSCAFLDMCRTKDLKPSVLLDGRKAFGLAQMRPTAIK